jgi:excinuclease ABC subunit C
MTEHPAEPASAPFDGKAFVRGLSNAPGVYRMFASDGSVLYVGKAGALRKRVASYFSATPKQARTMAMLAQVTRMEVVVTRSEAEALLLENQLIKSTYPRYNVLLRDDKSYPYVLLTQEPWPRLALHRGARAVPGRYFGPYPGVGAVRETLNLMHRLFRLRSCEDSVFRNRSRPCLQYQIGRCSAPCVGLVPAREYAQSVRRVGLFLDGRSDELTDELDRAMAASSARLDFEEAARIRDLIGAIRKLQARQYVPARCRAPTPVCCCWHFATVAILAPALSSQRPTVSTTRPRCCRRSSRSTTPSSRRPARSCSTATSRIANCCRMLFPPRSASV